MCFPPGVGSTFSHLLFAARALWASGSSRSGYPRRIWGPPYMYFFPPSIYISIYLSPLADPLFPSLYVATARRAYPLSLLFLYLHVSVYISFVIYLSIYSSILYLLFLFLSYPTPFRPPLFHLPLHTLPALVPFSLPVPPSPVPPPLSLPLHVTVTCVPPLCVCVRARVRVFVCAR